jgi:hypothetical protein
LLFIDLARLSSSPGIDPFEHLRSALAQMLRRYAGDESSRRIAPSPAPQRALARSQSASGNRSRAATSCCATSAGDAGREFRQRVAVAERSHAPDVEKNSRALRSIVISGGVEVAMSAAEQTPMNRVAHDGLS